LCIGNEHRQTNIAVEEEDLDRKPVMNKPGTRKPRTRNGNTCPIDTSKGINVGLTGSLAIHARIDHWWGSIESLFYENESY
jgi:hypothetical protein